MAASALETEKLCKSFGALTVADNISFRLEPGARHALIGPNGAGKTTFFNVLTGRVKPSRGSIRCAQILDSSRWPDASACGDRRLGQ